MMSFFYNNNARLELHKFIPKTSKTLLDVGCNTGEFGRVLKVDNEIEIWGVEPNPITSQVAVEYLDHVVCDLFQENIPIPDGYFDVITFNDSLEHFPFPDQALILSKGKLKEDGVIVFSIPNVRQIDNLEHLLFEKDWCYEDSGIRDRTHLRFFTKKSIIDLFNNCGYEVISIEGINEKYWHETKYFRRILYKLIPSWMEDTKYTQFAGVARLI